MGVAHDQSMRFQLGMQSPNENSAKSLYSVLIDDWSTGTKLYEALTASYGDVLSFMQSSDPIQILTNKDWSELPSIEVLGPEFLGNHAGAFSHETNTIYIHSDAEKRPNLLRLVLAHELAHWIDHRINGAGMSHADIEAFVQSMTGINNLHEVYNPIEREYQPVSSDGSINLPGGRRVNAEFFATGIHIGLNSDIKSSLSPLAISILNDAEEDVDSWTFAEDPSIFLGQSAYGLQSNSASHFDNNNIAGGLSSIQSRWQDGIADFYSSYIESRDSSLAIGGFNDQQGLANPSFTGEGAGVRHLLYRFGQIAHALEDFYSHTTWIDLIEQGIIGEAQILDDTLDIPKVLRPGELVPGTANVLVAQKGANWSEILRKVGNSGFLGGFEPIYWKVNPQTRVMSGTTLDGRTVYGLASGATDGLVYGDRDDSMLMRDPDSKDVIQAPYLGFSHGGIAGTIGGLLGDRWISPLNKDDPEKYNHKKAKDLARLQIQNEWDRMGNLIFRNYGIKGLEHFAKYAISSEYERSKFISTYSSSGGRDIELYGANGLVDRYLVTGSIEVGDANKRDGIVQLQLATRGGEKLLGTGVHLGGGLIATSAHTVAQADLTSGNNIAYFGVTPADAFSEGGRANIVYSARIEKAYIYPHYNSIRDIGRDLAILSVGEDMPTTISGWAAYSPASYDSAGNPIGQSYFPARQLYAADKLVNPEARYYFEGYASNRNITTVSQSSYTKRTVLFGYDINGNKLPSTTVEVASVLPTATSLNALLGTRSDRAEKLHLVSPDISAFNNIPEEDAYNINRNLVPLAGKKWWEQTGDWIADTAGEIAKGTIDVISQAGNVLESGIEAAQAAASIAIGIINGVGEFVGEFVEDVKDLVTGHRKPLVQLKDLSSAARAQGDTHLYSLLNIEAALGDSGSPLIEEGKPGEFRGLVTAVDSSFRKKILNGDYYAAGSAGTVVNLLGYNEIEWIKRVKEGLVVPNTSIKRLTDTPEADGPLGDLGFASSLNPKRPELISSVNPITLLGRTPQSRILVPDISYTSAGNYVGWNLIQYNLRIVNASRVRYEGFWPLEIGITAQNLRTGKTEEIHRDLLTDKAIEANLLGDGVEYVGTFELDSSRLPDFEDNQDYLIKAVVDPGNRIPETLNLVNEATIGVYTISKIKGPKEGSLSMEINGNNYSATTSGDLIDEYYSPKFIADARLVYSASAGDSPLSRLVLSRTNSDHSTVDPWSSPKPYEIGSLSIPSTDMVSISELVSSFTDYANRTAGNDYYLDEERARKAEDIEFVSLSLSAQDELGMRNSPLGWKMPLTHSASRLSVVMPTLLLPESPSRLRIRFRDVDGESMYKLKVYDLSSDAIQALAQATGMDPMTRTDIGNVDLSNSTIVYEDSLYRTGQDASSLLSYEVNDLLLTKGTHQLFFELADEYGNIRRYNNEHLTVVSDFINLASTPRVRISRGFVESSPLMSTFLPRADRGHTAYISSNAYGMHVPILLTVNGQEVVLKSGAAKEVGTDDLFSQEVDICENQVIWTEGFNNSKKIYLYNIDSQRTTDILELTSNAEDVSRLIDPNTPLTNRLGIFWTATDNSGMLHLYHIKAEKLARQGDGISIVDEIILPQGHQKYEIMRGSSDSIIIWGKSTSSEVGGYESGQNTLYIYDGLQGVNTRSQSLSNTRIQLNPVACNEYLAVCKEDLGPTGRAYELYKYDPNTSEYSDRVDIIPESLDSPFPRESTAYNYPQIALSDGFFAWISSINGSETIFVYNMVSRTVSEISEARASSIGRIALDGARLIWDSQDTIYSTLLFTEPTTGESSPQQITVTSILPFISESTLLVSSEPQEVFSIRRTGDLSKPIDILGSFYGTAIEGVDFTSEFKGFLHFDKGQSEQTVAISPTPNGFKNGNRSLTFSVEPGPGYVSDSTATDVSVIILDDPSAYGASIDIRTDNGRVVKTNTSSRLGDLIAFDYTSYGSRTEQWFEITNNSPEDLEIEAVIQSYSGSDGYTPSFQLITDAGQRAGRLRSLENVRIGILFEPEKNFPGHHFASLRLDIKSGSDATSKNKVYSFQVRASSSSEPSVDNLGQLYDIAPLPTLNAPGFALGQADPYFSNSSTPLFTGPFTSRTGKRYRIELVNAIDDSILDHQDLDGRAVEQIWELKPTTALSEGINSVYTRLIELDSNSSTNVSLESAHVDIRIDSSLPSPPRDLKWKYKMFNPLLPVLEGQADPNSEIRLEHKGITIRKVLPDSAGVWFMDLSAFGGLLTQKSITSGYSIVSHLVANGSSSAAVTMPLQDTIDVIRDEDSTSFAFKPTISMESGFWRLDPPSVDYVSETVNGNSLPGATYNWIDSAKGTVVSEQPSTDFSLDVNTSYELIVSIVDDNVESRSVSSSITPLDLAGNSGLFAYQSGVYVVVDQLTNSSNLLVGPDLEPISAQKQADWLPIAAESTIDINRVLMRNTRDDRYQIWRFTESWQYDSVLDTFSGSSLNLRALLGQFGILETAIVTPSGAIGSSSSASGCVRTLGDMLAGVELPDDSTRFLEQYAISSSASRDSLASIRDAVVYDVSAYAADTQQFVVDTFLADEVKASAYILIDRTTGKVFDFTYNSKLGLGAELLDDNANGLVDRLRFHVADDSLGDAERQVVGLVRIPGLLVAEVNNGNGAASAITGNGAFQEGVTLAAGTVSGDPDGDGAVYAYQWFFNNIAISGANASSYNTSATGFGAYKVALSYTDGKTFTATVESAEQAIAKVNNGNGAAGAISGNGAYQVGVTLTAGGVSGDPDGDGSVTAYQWFKNGSAISNAIRSSYDTTATGVGTYKVALTYTDGQGFSAIVESGDVDIITGRRTIRLSPGTQVASIDGIIERFEIGSGGVPSSPPRITNFNPTEDLLQISEGVSARATQRTLFTIRPVERPDGPLTKSQAKSLKKQQKAQSNALKNLGRGKLTESFAYNQLTGQLFFDANNKKKGFGEGGGLLAVLEDNPAIGINNLEFL